MTTVLDGDILTLADMFTEPPASKLAALLVCVSKLLFAFPVLPELCDSSFCAAHFAASP